MELKQHYCDGSSSREEINVQSLTLRGLTRQVQFIRQSQIPLCSPSPVLTMIEIPRYIQRGASKCKLSINNFHIGASCIVSTLIEYKCFGLVRQTHLQIIVANIMFLQ